jgi:peroxiredoxin
MNRKKIFIFLAFVAVAAALGAYFYSKRTPFEHRKPSVGDWAPEIALADLTGQMVTLSSLKGRVVLVNFWTSWCPPCKAGMEISQKAYSSYRERGFEVVGVILDQVGPSFLGEAGVTYPLAVANERVLASYGKVTNAGVPQSFLIDRSGRIAVKVKGFYPEERLTVDIERALGR